MNVSVYIPQHFRNAVIYPDNVEARATAFDQFMNYISSNVIQNIVAEERQRCDVAVAAVQEMFQNTSAGLAKEVRESVFQGLEPSLRFQEERIGYLSYQSERLQDTMLNLTREYEIRIRLLRVGILSVEVSNLNLTYVRVDLMKYESPSGVGHLLRVLENELNVVHQLHTSKWACNVAHAKASKCNSYYDSQGTEHLNDYRYNKAILLSHITEDKCQLHSTWPQFSLMTHSGAVHASVDDVSNAMKGLYDTVSGYAGPVYYREGELEIPAEEPQFGNAARLALLSLLRWRRTVPVKDLV